MSSTTSTTTTMTPPLSPLDDPSRSLTNDPLTCPPLKWGIIGCGRVSHDFVQALKLLPTAQVVAAAARNIDSAQAFATKHGIKKYYGGYDELLADSDVDIVYVGNIHAFRRETGEKCLLANKHVLLEKPFALNTTDAEYLINLAKERQLFIMEGMWTRFFPAVELARKIVLQDKQIGEVVSVHSDFNFNASDNEEYPSSFVYNHKLGGGASFLLAPYPIAAATLFFNGATPDHVKVVGQVDKTTGVDLQAVMAVSFPPTSDLAPAVDDTNTKENTPKLPGAGSATLSFGLVGESAEETTVIGTKGRLTICTPGHCPTKLILQMKGSGRGQSAGSFVYEYPIPIDTEEIVSAGGYVYPNSSGFAYEAAAVARCIAAGKIEPPQYTHDDTLNNMRMVDQIRSQLGIREIE